MLAAEELCVREQLDEVWSVSWLNMVALQVQRDVLESGRVSVDVQRPHTISTLILS